MRLIKTMCRFPAKEHGSSVSALFTNGMAKEDDGYEEYRVYAEPGSDRAQNLQTIEQGDPVILVEIALRDGIFFDLVEPEEDIYIGDPPVPITEQSAAPPPPVEGVDDQLPFHIFKARVRFEAGTKGGHVDVLFTNGLKQGAEGYEEYRVFADPGSARAKMLEDLRPGQWVHLAQLLIKGRIFYNIVTYDEDVDVTADMRAKKLETGLDLMADIVSGIKERKIVGATSSNLPSIASTLYISVMDRL